LTQTSCDVIGNHGLELGMGKNSVHHLDQS
jgi:hypothetical protein